MSSQQLRNYAALKYTVEELADALESELEYRFGGRTKFNGILQRGFDREMKPVRKARKLLETLR